MSDDATPATDRGSGFNDGLGLLPERAIRDIANGLNGVQPMLGQWERDLRLARAVEATERERADSRRAELVAAWNDLPDALRCHPGLARLYAACQKA